MERPPVQPLVTTCANGVLADWDQGELLKLAISGIARQYRHLNQIQREDVLSARPTLTGTPWDALLAAVVEHLANLHGCEAPGWVNEPERFLNRPKHLSPDWTLTPTMAMAGLTNAPAAFLRHGIVTDPRNLDERGGELERWSDERSQ